MRESCRPSQLSYSNVSLVSLRLPLGRHIHNQSLPVGGAAIKRCAHQADGLPLGKRHPPLSASYSDVRVSFFAKASDYGTTSQEHLSESQVAKAACCRPCLIACNSRKFTRGQAPTLPPVPGEGFSGDR
jgi:hypothetical protein